MSERIPERVRRCLPDQGQDPPRSRRIFTNRALEFESIEAIGFDMDYTLAVYRQRAMDELSVAATVAKLVRQGYPRTLEGMTPDPQFAVRGLIIDKERGNLLKLDRHGYVGRVFHGHQRVPREERKALYSAQRISQDPERFAWADTLFALPEVTIFAHVVELIDHHPETFDGPAPSYEAAWNDVRAAIDLCHQDDSIKSVIKARPGDFLENDPELPAALHKLRSSGKRLFLLTNSFYPYTNVLMTHLLNGRRPEYEQWQSYFDWIIVGSRKPAFFEPDRVFLEIDPGTGAPSGVEVEVPLRGRIYQGGGREGLQEALGVRGDEVLYVGDHIYGDIVKSKKSSSWRTALVISELEHDIEVRESHRLALQEVEQLSELRNRLAEESGDQRHLLRQVEKLSPEDLEGEGDVAARAEVLDEALRATRQRHERLRRHLDHTIDRLRTLRRETGSAFNPYWGSVFSERDDTSLFGAQVENYACVYTSRVSNFGFVSPSRSFHAPHGSLPHW